MRRLPRTLGVLVCMLFSAAGTATVLRAQSPNVPPDGIVFRAPFVDASGNVIQPNVARPESIFFRDPFIGDPGLVTNQLVPAPDNLDFREPFLDAGGSVTQTLIAPPDDLEYRPAFLDVDGHVIVQHLAPPRGLVFRDPFLYSDGNRRITAAPESAPDRHLLHLSGVAPNPFNPGTQVSFRLAEAAEVTVSVLDLQGRLVRTLQKGRLPADLHVVRWDGRDASGRTAASGVYVFQIQAGPERIRTKAVLLK